MALKAFSEPARYAIATAEAFASAQSRPVSSIDVVHGLCASPLAVAGGALRSLGLRAPDHRSAEVGDGSGSRACEFTLAALAAALRSGAVHADSVDLLLAAIELDPTALPSLGVQNKDLEFALLPLERNETIAEYQDVAGPIRAMVHTLAANEALSHELRDQILAYWRGNLREIGQDAARAAHAAVDIDPREAFNAAYIHAADQVLAEILRLAGLSGMP